MTTYPPLNKALVIDPSGELRDFLRFCAGRLWPDLQIVSYPWARGCPDESYEWAGLDLILLEQRLHNPHDQGIEWLRAMRRNPAAPAVMLISGELTESLRAEAARIGAAAVLDKNDLSPRRFAEYVAQVLHGESTADAHSAPPETPSSVSQPAAHAAATAPQIPGFRTVQPLATTERGWLSLVTDESNGRTLALKIVRMTAEEDRDILRRFEHEYGVLSALQDANVIKVFKRGVVESGVFIAMEYCTGGDLKARIERGISLEDAVGYLVQIMRGLKAAHARGILHRNLKPTNLLFREDGTLVLADFGIQRAADNLGYDSPESIRGEMVDLRSDLYSAGIIFQHALAGTPLQPLIDGLLEERPDDRFQSAVDVLDGIEWMTHGSV